MHPLIILLGLPGSGKGTQGKRLAKDRGMAYIATGDLVREVSRRAGTGNAFADVVSDRNKRGIPQPDHVILAMLREKLGSIDLGRGIILDAFPISLGQTQMLEMLRREFFLQEPLVLFITINRWESVKRLTVRKFCLMCKGAFNPDSMGYQEGVCPNDGARLITRDDDQFSVVLRRMEEYTFRMHNIRDYYRKKGWVVDINGAQSIDAAYKEVTEALEHRGLRKN